ncbi:hypothetical protein RRG08_046598 [Elysia crispata]|uniref:Uncharacterized protein n=1 Tax=Elysia crispata TaxID=231223 RepID=A0AAE1E227_9GAST|nr:hypothetical protein RRG08_046598 [Elysia crispata]
MPDLHINMVSIIPMLERMKAATEKDEYLQTSRQYTQMGWPSDKHPLTRVLCLISRKKISVKKMESYIKENKL